MVTKYQFSSSNAFIDGVIINDFDSEDEAIQFAADYEATLFRIEPDGSRKCVYYPGMYS